MSSGSKQYTLVGFSAELDYRPLRFLKPLPPNRVCSACGLVRPKILLLPCAHALCESCYEQCAENGRHVCPLDGYQCQDEEVIGVDFPADELFSREVKCWNERNGCVYVAAASLIAQHFQRDCGHHCVPCPKCSATVPCSSVIPHLKNGFCVTVKSATSDDEGELDCQNSRGSASSAKDTFEKHAGEVKELLGQIMLDVKAHGERLSEISHGINSLKETQQHEVALGVERHESLRGVLCKLEESNQELKGGLASRSDIDNLSGSIKRLEKMFKDEMRNQASQNRDKLTQPQTATATGGADAAAQENNELNLKVTRDEIRSISQETELNRRLCLFVVKNVRSLHKIAKRENWALYGSENVYLCGYNVAPGVCLIGTGGSVKLHAWIRLNKGNLDDVVRWPFQHRVRLGVVHPTTSANRSLEVTADPSNLAVQKPTSSANFGDHFRNNYLSVEDLIRDGYVENDQLRVMFQLLP